MAQFVLPLSEVLVHSSNIGMSKVGLAIGADRLLDGLSRLGFWRSTGSGLPGEVGGLRPAVEACAETHTIPSLTMGHAMSVTALQMLTAFNALGNGGRLLRPALIQQITATDGTVLRRHEPECVRQVYTNEPAMAWIRDALTRVCRPGGTAPRASLLAYGIEVAGKTGTAEKVVNGRYSSDHKVCSFIAMAPAANPVYSIYVVFDEPTAHPDNLRHYGGTVAAPVVREVLLRSFQTHGQMPARDE